MCGPTRAVWFTFIFVTAMVVTTGCSERLPPFTVGGGCELTVDCEAPLVCLIGACRQECRELRDCRAGLICVRDADGFGGCQLEDERECALMSDCPEGLVCLFGLCTNMCNSDRDCVNGLVCAPDEDKDMQLACMDPTESECRISSDCPPNLTCARDRRCREACREDRDCRDGQSCDQGVSPRVCFTPLTP